MKLIYIAAHYTENPPECTAIAAAAAERIKQDGRAFPICPHLLGAGNGDPEYMYAGTLETMRRCDAVLTLPRWEQSRGAMSEVRTADRMLMPVFHNEPELLHWLSGGQVGTSHGQRGNLAELCAGLPQTLVLLEVNTGEEHEIRQLGKQPGDGLIYTCWTRHGIRLASSMGAEFVQVDRP